MSGLLEGYEKAFTVTGGEGASLSAVIVADGTGSGTVDQKNNITQVAAATTSWIPFGGAVIALEAAYFQWQVINEKSKNGEYLRNPKCAID